MNCRTMNLQKKMMTPMMMSSCGMVCSVLFVGNIRKSFDNLSIIFAEHLNQTHYVITFFARYLTRP